MLNFHEMKIESCLEELKRSFRRNYGNSGRPYRTAVLVAAELALESISRSDALYHDLEHTILAALAGQAILEGKRLSEEGIAAKDWAEFTIALLCHDIGYVRGVCTHDGLGLIATGVAGERVEVEGSDAALGPYHVDRSKLFVRERLGQGLPRRVVVDGERIASFIEMTRFPVPSDGWYEDTRGLAGLVRAADLIGQLADPQRLQKCTALFYEFEELGFNGELGYETPADLREDNARFYWDVAFPYLQDALDYLRVTPEGKQWLAQLEANVSGADGGHAEIARATPA